MFVGNISCYSAELFVVEADDYDKAQSIMTELADEHDDVSQSFTWGCPKCGETLEPQFNECWKCSYVREEGEED